MMKNVLTPIEDRLWAKVKKTDKCWIWLGSKSGKYQHGEIGIGRRKDGKAKTHRVSYEITYGKIPDGLQVLHKCDNGLCVRPDHLFLGTQKDNMIDCSTKGRSVNQNTRKTHCKRGHELSGDNLWLRGKYRQCRICVRERDRKYKLQRRLGK